MPLVHVVAAFNELEAEQLLVDFQRAVDDPVGRKIFLQKFLVDRVLLLFNLVEIVPQIPEVYLFLGIWSRIESLSFSLKKLSRARYESYHKTGTDLGKQSSFVAANILLFN